MLLRDLTIPRGGEWVAESRAGQKAREPPTRGPPGRFTAAARRDENSADNRPNLYAIIVIY